MFVKRGMTEDVYGMALQRLNDRAKAGLPEPQCPGRERAPSSVARLYTAARATGQLPFRWPDALRKGRWPMRPFKDMSTEPTLFSTLRRNGTWEGLRGASPKATESP